MKNKLDKLHVALLIVILCTNILAVNLLLDSKRQRAQASGERRETICILKILPAERVAHPERVDNCKYGGK